MKPRDLLRTELGMKFKNVLRPLKQKLCGKSGIYKVIELTKEPKLILDIGAAIGETAIPMARAFPGARIICFEPIQFDRLLLRTRKIPNIQSFNLALGNFSGTTEFYVPKHKDAASMKDYGFEAQKISGVRVETLDHFKFAEIDLLKIDAEGSEKEIFEGATETLKRTKAIFVEINTELVNMEKVIDIFEILKDSRFKLIGTFSDFYFKKEKKS